MNAGDIKLFRIDLEIIDLTDKLNNDYTKEMSEEEYHHSGGRLEALKWVRSLLTADDKEEE